MINGMTGFGSSQFSVGSLKGIVEVKTLNHRYFDISYYLPIGFGSVEEKVKQLIQKSIDRGRVTVSVKLVHKPLSVLKFNRMIIREYVHQAKRIGKAFGLKDELSLSDLIKLPGVIDVDEEHLDAETLWPALERSLKTALKSVIQMRQREGHSLARDIQKQSKSMLSQLKQIHLRSQIIFNEKKKQLTSDEFISFQKNSDVNEELARLHHYIDEVRLLLKTNIAVGKKIDFIAQEMQRETNTIGSKLQDKLVSSAVIALKSKVEKIREQSQNIE